MTLAGCSGGGGDGSDDGSDGGGGGDGGDGDGGGDRTTGGDDGTTAAAGDGSSGSGEFVRESMGSVGTNAVDELEVVAWESSVTDGQFAVRVAVRNTGDRRTDVSEYSYRAVPYDESGAELETNGYASAYTGKTEAEPGGVGTVRVMPQMSAEASAVAAYEVTVSCEGPFAEGVYCDG